MTINGDSPTVFYAQAEVVRRLTINYLKIAFFFRLFAGSALFCLLLSACEVVVIWNLGIFVFTLASPHPNFDILAKISFLLCVASGLQIILQHYLNQFCASTEKYITRRSFTSFTLPRESAASSSETSHFPAYLGTEGAKRFSYGYILPGISVFQKLLSLICVSLLVLDFAEIAMLAPVLLAFFIIGRLTTSVMSSSGNSLNSAEKIRLDWFSVARLQPFSELSVSLKRLGSSAIETCSRKIWKANIQILDFKSQPRSIFDFIIFLAISLSVVVFKDEYLQAKPLMAESVLAILVVIWTKILPMALSIIQLLNGLVSNQALARDVFQYFKADAHSEIRKFASRETAKGQQKIQAADELFIEFQILSKPSFVNIELNKISFYGGRIYGLQGASGVGKTSLGRALTDNTVDKAWEIEKVSFSVIIPQLISQSSILVPGTIRENILGKDGTPLSKERLDAIWPTIGVPFTLESVIDPDKKKVSGGQQQKICFLRGIFSGSNFIIFDEIFSGLDESSISTLMGLLRQFVDKEKVVICISHQGSVLKRLDYVINV